MWQGRPALLFGDVVYVRAEEQWSVEYAAAVVAIETTLVFLSMPNKFWSSPPMKVGRALEPLLLAPLWPVFQLMVFLRFHSGLERGCAFARRAVRVEIGVLWRRRARLQTQRARCFTCASHLTGRRCAACMQHSNTRRIPSFKHCRHGQAPSLLTLLSDDHARPVAVKC